MEAVRAKGYELLLVLYGVLTLASSAMYYAEHEAQPKGPLSAFALPCGGLWCP